MPRLKKELDNENNFRELYKAAYNFNVEEGKKVVGIDTACALWDLFIPAASCKFLEQWKQFLQDKKTNGKLIAVSKDVW